MATSSLVRLCIYVPGTFYCNPFKPVWNRHAIAKMQLREHVASIGEAPENLISTQV